MHSKEDINTALDGLSQFLSNNIGFISEGLILSQKTLDIESQDILSIIQSLMTIRDQIEDKVVEIKRVMEGRTATGVEIEY
jgi:hypothetical protein